MTTTLTPNLKLRIDSKLTSNAKYNLQRIDLLGSTFLVDSTNTLNLRSQTDIVIEPNSADLGGSGTLGSVGIGTANHKITALNVYATDLNLNGNFNLMDLATSSTGKLGLRYNSATSGSKDDVARTLTLDVNEGNRQLVLAGNLSLLGGSLELNVPAGTNAVYLPAGPVTLVGKDTVDTLTNKTINVANGNGNVILNLTDSSIAAGAAIMYSKLYLVDSIKDSDIKSNAAIAYTKLALTGKIQDADIDSSHKITYSKLSLTNSITNADVSPTADIAYSKLNLEDSIVDGDVAPGAAIQGTKILPQFGAQNIRTSATLELDNGTYITALAPASGGQTENLTIRLPSNNGSPNAILSTDGAGNLSWSSAGSGSVTSVSLSAPAEFIISGSPVTTAGTLTLTKANQAANQVYAGPTTGAAAQPSFRSLVLADLPALTKADVGLDQVANVDSRDPSTIIQTSSYRFVTDTEKSTWNGKQNALGFTPEDVANKGAANGYAPLNASGKIENSYLNATVMNYHGSWDASTNTPALSDGMVGADPGDVYIVSVGGTQNLGSGSITFAVGDWVIYNQSNVWQKVSNSSAVSSVNGATGAVTVNAINELTGDVTAGPASGSQSKAATIANGAITNAKVSASAAISVSKLAAGVDGYVIQTVSGVPTWTPAPASVASYKDNWVTADGTTKVVTHNLGSTDVMIQVFDKSNGQSIEVDTAIRTDSNTATLTASQSPGASGWRVLILKL